MANNSVLLEKVEYRFQAIPVEQPIGVFYSASIDYRTLREISMADVRRLNNESRDVETYLGIQRPLDKKRVAEIGHFVTTRDACFPTSVILAISGKHAFYDSTEHELVVRNFDPSDPDKSPISKVEIAKVLDGQHRIAGFHDLNRDKFDVNVSIFIDIDIEDQAYLFSTVNLAQTKVHKSLVYDLFEYSKARSPQKTCHNITVALDRLDGCPFHKRIKRLGTSTEGRFGETLTQATFVEALLPFLSKEPEKDRDTLLRGKKLPLPTSEELAKTPFRRMFVAERDLEIGDIVLYYFEAVRERWPKAWGSTGTGLILNRTNGFKALMRVLRPAYRYLTSDGVPSKDEFMRLLKRTGLTDDDFNTDQFKPGTAGESALAKRLEEDLKLK
jgi:DGQHR domain-containing protein